MKNGIYTDLSIEDYHVNKTHYSATSIKMANRSLKDFRWFLDNPKDERKVHLDFGNAFELSLLDQVAFANSVAVLQDKEWYNFALEANPELKTVRNSSVYKAAKRNFEEQNAGKLIIDDYGENGYDTIQQMMESCYKDAVIRQLISGIEYQLSIFWTDEETGINLKTRPDICKRKKEIIVNLKTTLDGSPKGFSRDLAKYDYPLQAAIEIEGIIQSGAMSTVDNYFWLVVEKVPPFNATIYEFQKDDRDLMEDRLHWLLRKMQAAFEQDKWPGYSDRADNQYGILNAELPLYYKL